MSEAAKLSATWETEVLDDGRMVLLRVRVSPDCVKAEVRNAFMTISRHAPPKGFRAGHVPEGVLRRLHGEKVLERVRKDLIARTLESVSAEAAKKHGFDQKMVPPPKSVAFSEDKGLFYETIVTGLAETGPPRLSTPSSVVDLRGRGA